MAKPVLDDELWRLIEPILPASRMPSPRGGRPRVSNRATLTGILFVLKTGIPWEYLPAEMGRGSGMTCWRRLRDWTQAGVWAKLHETLLARLQSAGKIDWSRAAVDSASVRAAGRGKKRAQACGPREARLQAKPHGRHQEPSPADLVDHGGQPQRRQRTGPTVRRGPAGARRTRSAHPSAAAALRRPGLRLEGESPGAEAAGLRAAPRPPRGAPRQCHWSPSLVGHVGRGLTAVAPSPPASLRAPRRHPCGVRRPGMCPDLPRSPQGPALLGTAKASPGLGLDRAMGVTWRASVRRIRTTSNRAGYLKNTLHPNTFDLVRTGPGGYRG